MPRESFPPGRPILAGAVELMKRIRKDFKYDPKATLISTPLAEAFEKRGGVCQDFAHIMIAGLRGLGLPACYVSGYIRTIPPEGQPRLEGADASHAWVRVWCGDGAGWLGLDPTNAHHGQRRSHRGRDRPRLFRRRAARRRDSDRRQADAEGQRRCEADRVVATPAVIARREATKQSIPVS